MNTIREIAARVLLIFPFEEPIYKDAGILAEFVGHPLIDLTPPGKPGAFARRLGFDPAAPMVAVLPGSRPNEVRTNPARPGAAARSSGARAGRAVRRGAGAEPRRPLFAVPRGQTAFVCGRRGRDRRGARRRPTSPLTASGTATVQAALHDTPMVIVYRLSPLTYRLGRRLVKVDTFGMVNLIAGETHRAGADSGAFTPAAVADEAVSMLTDRARAARVRDGLARVRQQLGGPGASRRAAQAILKVVSTMRTATVLLLMLLAADRAGATVLLPADLGDLSRDAYAIGRG